MPSGGCWTRRCRCWRLVWSDSPWPPKPVAQLPFRAWSVGRGYVGEEFIGGITNRAASSTGSFKETMEVVLRFGPLTVSGYVSGMEKKKGGRARRAARTYRSSGEDEQWRTAGSATVLIRIKDVPV